MKLTTQSDSLSFQVLSLTIAMNEKPQKNEIQKKIFIMYKKSKTTRL